MTFREIQPDDAERIFAIRIATWYNARGRDELAAMGITPESVRQLLQAFHRGWLCEIAGRAVGFAMGNAGTGEMRGIAVLRECQGRDIGRKLLGHGCGPGGCNLTPFEMRCMKRIMTRTQIQFPEPLYQRLKEIAERQD